MSVFTWSNPYRGTNPIACDWSNDNMATAMLIASPTCGFCGKDFEDGQRVWQWDAATRIVTHADCLKERASGIIRDIGEVIR